MALSAGYHLYFAFIVIMIVYHNVKGEWTCPSGWNFYKKGGSCIRGFYYYRNWSDARAMCQSYGGDLVTVEDVDKDTFLNGLPKAEVSGWMGLHKTTDNVSFVWLDQKTPLTYTQWKLHQPNGISGEQGCVAFTTSVDGTSLAWNNINCKVRKYLTCESKAHYTDENTFWGCPVDWAEGEDSCYKVFSSPHPGSNWLQSQNACLEQNGFLVSVSSRYENSFVLQALQNATRTKGYEWAWIGLRNKERRDQMLSTDGLRGSRYSDWESGQPDLQQWEFACGAIDGDNHHWSVKNCFSYSRYWVCEKYKSLQNKTEPLLPTGCKGGTGYQDKCYQSFDIHKSFQDAQHTCSSLGGDLVTVNDRFVQAFLTGVLATSPSYWIGLYNTATFSGTDTTSQSYGYAWTSGVALDFTAWDREHTEHETNTCVAMENITPSVGLWKDFPCNETKGFICEYPRPGQTTVSTATNKPHVICPQGWIGIRDVCYKVAWKTEEH